MTDSYKNKILLLEIKGLNRSDTDQVLLLDALLLALPVEGTVIKTEGWCGRTVGGARGRTSGAREFSQEPLVLTLDAAHLVAGEGKVLMDPTASDRGTAKTGDELHPVHPSACAQHAWRHGREQKICKCS